MDWIATIIVGLLSLLGTCVGSWGGARLMSYRIEQLEKKVEKHNQVVERVYRLEEYKAVAEEQFKVTNHRLKDVEEELRHEQSDR